MKRRQFLRTALASTLASSAAFQALALSKNNRYRNDIGIQLYTLRNQLKADLAGTLKSVAEAGYKQVECYGFPDAEEMIKVAKDNGLAVNSSHFAWESVTDPKKEGVAPFAQILDQANEAGLTHLVVPYVHGHNRETLDDYKRLAENCNKASVEAKKAGVQLAYHNHAFEFEPKEGGKSGYDVFVEEFDSDMMFEIDVFWVVVGGVDPVKLIKKLKGRVSQLHLKDLKKGTTLPEFGQLPKDAFKELGNGMIDIEPIIKVAEKAGVSHCHVEQDQSPDPIKSVQQSIQYLGSL
ncbi:sugar phosphate isomerase/epimerase family protein [Pelagicoccus mobilis]|uniref:Sugar phosphate isomerase/epimerase n=1 Tax=Pelagicoccus mobilis TaxID=415221 RepID=A0A934RVK6_9BACT|nr:sugar phosphate isomerase/epimerase [Pelagicoccus mobilis]MBK1875232.1 sugar phosphate isomerase/epimerase [Pelagicoccus mobilis]